MKNTYTMKLNSPITEEQWDAITDVDFDNTEHIWFQTKHGKKVHFYKNAIPIEWLLKWNKAQARRGLCNVLEMINDWRKENGQDN